MGKIEKKPKEEFKVAGIGIGTGITVPSGCDQDHIDGELQI